MAHRQLSTTAGKSQAQNKTTLVAGEVVNVKYGFSILDFGNRRGLEDWKTKCYDRVCFFLVLFRSLGSFSFPKYILKRRTKNKKINLTPILA